MFGYVGVIMSLTPFRVGASAPSSQMIQYFTFEEDYIPREVKDLASQMHSEMQENSRSILKNLDKFSEQMEKLRQPLDNYCSGALKELESGNLTEERVLLIKRLLKTTKTATDVIHKTSMQTIELRKRGREIFSERVFNVVCMAMQARQNELITLQEKLEICYRQEDHEIGAEIERHSQAIRIETQIYNQIFNLEKISPLADREISQINPRAQIGELIMDEKRKLK